MSFAFTLVGTLGIVVLVLFLVNQVAEYRKRRLVNTIARQADEWLLPPGLEGRVQFFDVRDSHVVRRWCECIRCRVEVDEEDLFCWHCGTNLRPPLRDS